MQSCRQTEKRCPRPATCKIAVDNRYGPSDGSRLLTLAFNEASETSKSVGGVGLAEHGHFCHAIVQRLQFASLNLLDEITEFGLEALAESHDSDICVCLEDSEGPAVAKRTFRLTKKRPFYRAPMSAS